MKEKAQRRAHAMRFTEDGLPRDPNEWTEEDWRDPNEPRVVAAIQDIKEALEKRSGTH